MPAPCKYTMTAETYIKQDVVLAPVQSHQPHACSWTDRGVAGVSCVIVIYIQLRLTAFSLMISLQTGILQKLQT